MIKMGETELESLKKVEKVNELIKRMANNAGNDAETFNEVDDFLKNCDGATKGFDRTLINKSSESAEEMSRNSFMQGIESDAKERAARKAEARAKAEKFKIMANDYFKACDYKKSIDLYTKAIDACRDYDVLYTNRAQAFIKVDMAQSAIDDCDLALRLAEGNHKALLHKGRALVRLGIFDEAMVCYERVLELAPNLKKYMKEFLDEAHHLAQLKKVKESSMSTFEGPHSNGDGALDLILDKLLSKTIESPEFYAGGIQLLVDIVKTSDASVDLLRDNFRNTTGLFDVGSKVQIVVHAIISKKCDLIGDPEWNMLYHWMELLSLLVKNDITIVSIALNTAALYDCLHFCARSSDKLPTFLLLSAISLFFHLSCVELAVQQIFDRFSLHNVLGLVIKSITSDKHTSLNIAGIGLFRNLVDSQRFKVALGKEDELLTTVIDCLYTLFASSLSNGSDQISSIVSIIDSLSDNSAFRIRLIKHDKFLNDCMTTIEARVALSADQKHSEILLKLFTFIHNLLLLTKNMPTGDKVKMIGLRVVQSSSSLIDNDPSVEMRSVLIQVISQMLVLLNDEQLRAWCESRSQSASTTDDDISICRAMLRKCSLTDQNYLEKVCKTLRLCIAILDVPNHPLLSSAVKILTLASRVSQAVLFLCCDVRERTLKLLSLLYKEKEPIDEVLAGNICLLMINSVNDTPLAEHLANSGVIRDLLRICADAKKTDCRRNAAILAGKLAQSSYVHKNELSRLNGFSIISGFNNWS